MPRGSVASFFEPTSDLTPEESAELKEQWLEMVRVKRAQKEAAAAALDAKASAAAVVPPASASPPPVPTSSTTSSSTTGMVPHVSEWRERRGRNARERGEAVRGDAGSVAPGTGGGDDSSDLPAGGPRPSSSANRPAPPPNPAKAGGAAPGPVARPGAAKAVHGGAADRAASRGNAKRAKPYISA